MSYAGIYYLFTMINGVDFLVGVLTILSVIASVCSVGLALFGSCIDRPTEHDRLITGGAQKISRYLIPITLVFTLLNILVPNRKDAAIIAGLYLGQEPIEKTIDGLGEVTPLLLDALKTELLTSKKKRQLP